MEQDLKGPSGNQSVGDQPEGSMALQHERRSLPGFPKDDTIKINFVFSDGIQTVRLKIIKIQNAQMHTCTIYCNCDTGTGVRQVNNH